MGVAVIMVIVVVIMILFIGTMIIGTMIIVIMILIVMIVIIMTVVVVMVIGMNPAIEVLGLTPDQGGTDSRFDGKNCSIVQAPAEHTTEQTIQGVVLRTVFEVFFKTTVPFNGNDRTEIEFSRL